jgi:hypothetical protein
MIEELDLRKSAAVNARLIQDLYDISRRLTAVGIETSGGYSIAPPLGGVIQRRPLPVSRPPQVGFARATRPVTEPLPSSGSGQTTQA